MRGGSRRPRAVEGTGIRQAAAPTQQGAASAAHRRSKACGGRGRRTFLVASSSFSVISSHFLRSVSFSAWADRAQGRRAEHVLVQMRHTPSARGWGDGAHLQRLNVHAGRGAERHLDEAAKQTARGFSVGCERSTGCGRRAVEWAHYSRAFAGFSGSSYRPTSTAIAEAEVGEHAYLRGEGRRACTRL